MSDWLDDGAGEWRGLLTARTAATAGPRRRASLVGVVRSVAVRRAPCAAATPDRAARPVAITEGTPSPLAFEVRLEDGTGEIAVRWSGRDAVAGVAPGVTLHVEGTVAELGGELVILNPLYRFVPGGSPARSTSW